MPDEMRRPMGLVLGESPGWELASRRPADGLARA
jgi:hypothetical protein